MVRLATWMPFRQASRELEFFSKVSIGEATIRETSERAGAVQVALQQRRAEEIQRERPPSPAGPAVQMLSLDGAFLQLVGGEWREVKTLALGVVEKAREEKGELVVHTSDLSYFSRMSDARTFEKQALVELFERGVEKAGLVCAVTDGADWIQAFIDLHRADGVRILDVPHAKERVSDVGDAIAEQGLELELLGKQEDDVDPTVPKKRKKRAKEEEADREGKEKKRVHIAWFERQSKELKTGDPTAVIKEIERLFTQMEERGISKAAQIIEKSLNYLKERRSMINYAAFQALGYPIGSGSVESANKLVVEARMKGAGMRWAEAHVDPMLALRNMACNDRWPSTWKLIQKDQFAQVQAKRAAKSLRRLCDLKADAPCAAQSPVPVLASPDQAQNQLPAAHPKSQSPAPPHPWRRPFLRKRPAS
jgi:hypothetical protein